MPRAFHVPGVIFLFCAFVLLFLVSISLPYLTALDVTRVHFNFDAQNATQTAHGNATMNQLRFGIWSYCYDVTDGARTCSPKGHGYSVEIFNAARTSSTTIGSSWTRGLAVHPVACGVTLIAFLLSLSTHVTFTLLASLAAFLGAALTLISFAIDIALYAFVKHEVGKLGNVSASTLTGPGFWMTFASFILLCLAGCTVCFGRRRDRMAGATSYPLASSSGKSWRDRFRKQ